MPESDYIQDGFMITYGADGSVTDTQHLNPQQLATEASRDKVLEYVGLNIPEGNPWTYVDVHLAMNNSNTRYNCPEWQAKAANGQLFNCGELYHNLFDYAAPTPAVIDELHRMAGGAPS